MTMDGGDTTTEFALEISVFKDQDYMLPYGIRDFPLKVALNKPLYVQVTTQPLNVNPLILKSAKTQMQEKSENSLLVAQRTSSKLTDDFSFLCVSH